MKREQEPPKLINDQPKRQRNDAANSLFLQLQIPEQFYRAVGRFENPGGGRSNEVVIIYPHLVGIELTDMPNTEGASGTPGSSITVKVSTYA